MGVFSIGESPEGYFIKLYNRISIDYNIAKHLMIPCKQYVELLIEFNAYYEEKHEECFFRHYEDIEKCISHLDEKYGVILALTQND